MNKKDKVIRFLLNWKGVEYPTRKELRDVLQIKDIDNLLDCLRKEEHIKLDEVQGNGDDDNIELVSKSYFYDKKIAVTESRKAFIRDVFISLISGSAGIVIGFILGKMF